MKVAIDTLVLFSTSYKEAIQVPLFHCTKDKKTNTYTNT